MRLEAAGSLELWTLPYQGRYAIINNNILRNAKNKVHGTKVCIVFTSGWKYSIQLVAIPNKITLYLSVRITERA